ncbi:MAG: hypothetical protein JKX73_11170 [Flavobacteriales bacterium]|nr:hypothetical protein [Flavobacteriales bacterium]
MKPLTILKSLFVKLIIVIACCLTLNNQAQASHAMGADFTYECLGGNLYVLKLSLYRDCSGAGAPTTVNINLTSTNCAFATTFNLPVTSVTEISSTCPTVLSTCQGGTEPGVEEHVFMDTVSITNSCSDFIFSYSLCCRNPTITNLVNPSSESLYIESTMDNTIGACNSSPVFSSLGVPYLCDSVTTNFNFGAFDIDGDSLVFSMINPLSASGNPIAYAVPYSVVDPIVTTDSVLFDTTNGQMSFTPFGLQVCIVTVLVQEYRAGVLIGSVMRDIQILIQNCATNQPPYMTSGGIINVVNGTQIDTSRVELCVGDNLSFDVTFSDSNSADTISLLTNILTAFPSAIVTVTGVNPITANFAWTPANADVGLNNLTMSVVDGVCPIMGVQNYSFEVNVLAGTFAGPDINLCLGDSAQMQGEGGSNFLWSPSTGLANDTLPNTMAYPSVTTTYVLTSNFAGSCDTIDSMTINVGATFTPNVISDQTICQGGSVQLTADGTPAQAYSFVWTGGTGLSSNTIGNPIASPGITTTYSVDILSPTGCMKSGSVTVTVDSTILNVNPSASALLLCPGGSTTLDANISATDTNYTITWEDSNAVVVGTAEIITVSPTASMTYTAIITNGVCTDSKSISIGMTELEIGIDSIALCSSDTFNANPFFAPIGNGVPTSCGATAGCNGSGGIAASTVGTGTAINGTTSYPAPFGNWYKNAKHQIMYTAADLNAAGITAGTITEIGFQVDVIAGTTLYKAYELKLGCTSINDLTNWEGGLTPVFLRPM